MPNYDLRGGGGGGGGGGGSDLTQDADGFITFPFPNVPPIKWMIDVLEDGRIRKSIIQKDASGIERLTAEKTD
jgi:hypothetical protein